MDKITLNHKAGDSIPAFFLQKVLSQTQFLPQTYLFYGPEYSGKEFLAIEFFKSLNCQQTGSPGYCGSCPSCKKIQSLSSTDLYLLFSQIDVRKIKLFCDFFLKNPIPAIESILKKEVYKLLIYLAPNKSAKKNLDPEKLYEIYEKPLSPSLIKTLYDFLDFAEGLSKNIPIELIRNTLEKIYLSSYELKYKLLLIKDAADLSQESSNTLLKTIEEPPANTIIILITSSLSRILPTIRSRSTKLKFKPYSQDQIQKTSQWMNHFPYQQLVQNIPNKSYLSENLTDLSQDELLILIDYLKKEIELLSPLGKEKYQYLNDLKSGMLFYNLPIHSVKQAVKILLSRKS